MVSNFLVGGKLGDFIHAMYTVKNLCEINQNKANLYLINDEWELGIQLAHKELKEFMLSQEYVQSVNLLDDSNKQYLLNSGYVNLSLFRQSPLLKKVCWTELHSRTFNFPISKEYAWITYTKVKHDLQGKVLIHRKYHNERINDKFPYDIIMKSFKDELVFISASERDYENFPYKDELPFVKVSSLDDWYSSINSCELFVSNLSAPTAMAHSLDKPRVVELANISDNKHCIGEERYSRNIRWYVNDVLNNL